MLPHVIGLLATRNRPAMAHQAAHMFFAQQYTGSKTLYVYDDGTEPFTPCRSLATKDMAVVHHPPIRLPTKRNQMMRRAIAADPEAIYFVWDDDDYNGPTRIARQVEALRAAPAADGCILCPFLSYNTQTQQLHRALQVNLHGMRLRVFTDANLAFRRTLWERLPWDEAVDPNACWRWMQLSHDQIIAIPAENDYVVVRHGRNHTQDLLPQVPDMRFWEQVVAATDVVTLLARDHCCDRD